MEKYRFSGYRIVEFAPASKAALQAIAERLIPRQEDILNSWVRKQCGIWIPPGLSREDLAQVFGDIFRNMLGRMRATEPEQCLGDLEESGRQLAGRQFPFEALIISVHFLEESYLPHLMNPPSPTAQKWLVAMDEFLHAALSAIATSYFEAYRKELLEEVEVGRIVQKELQSHIPKAVADLEVAHVYMSARERSQLGGDFLDYFQLDEGRHAFIVGDLSGHGVEAAADSVMLRSLFRGFMREDPDLARTMARMNGVVMTELRSDQLATALAFIYEPSGRLTMVGAGHPYPVLRDHKCRQIDVDGIALAVLPDAEYQTIDITLEPGSTLVIYTDGLAEARGSSGMFGDERVVEAVAAMPEASARTVVERLVDESLRFADGVFADDVAILVIKRAGKTIA